MEEVRTYCRICGAVCGLVVSVADGTVVGVRGDADHPVSHGYTCPKGRAVATMHAHPDRLDHPAVRDPGGERRPTTWAECLDDLAGRLDDVRRTAGTDAIAFYAATGTSHDALGGRYGFRFAQLLGTRSRYSAVSLDSPCKPLVAELMTGRTDVLPTLDPDAALTVLIGTNPLVSHGHYDGYADPVVRFRAHTIGGRELWVIDPRRTETARLATRHLQPRVGTDWLILAYAIRALLEEGGADKAYLATHAAGVERLHAAVSPVTLDEACRRTGVPAVDLVDLVEAIRRHGSIAAQTGTGTTMGRAANVTEWLTWAVHVVVASYDRPGGMWFNPGFLTGHDQRRPSPAAPWAPVPGPPSRPDLPSRLGEYPSVALADEIEAGNVRALLVLGGNPFNAIPQPARLAAAARQLDVLAVADIWETESTALATHVLPCTAQLERADVTTFLDQFLPQVSAQYSPRVLEPRADRWPAWRIFAELGARLGFDVLPPGVDSATVTEDELLAPLVDRGRRPFAELRDAGVLVDESAAYGWVERSLPDGRWQLAPRPLVEQLTALLAGDDGAGLVLVPRRQVRHLNSAMRGVTPPGGRADAPDVLVHPADAGDAGISDGDVVAVTSAYGTLVAAARVTDEIARGAVSVPHGWGGSAAVGQVVAATVDCDPLTGMPLQSGVAVTLSPRAPRGSASPAPAAPA